MVVLNSGTFTLLFTSRLSSRQAFRLLVTVTLQIMAPRVPGSPTATLLDVGFLVLPVFRLLVSLVSGVIKLNVGVAKSVARVVRAFSSASLSNLVLK